MRRAPTPSWCCTSTVARAAIPGRRRSASWSPSPAGRWSRTFSATIGETSNNVAEYRALLRGLELAAEHGAREVQVINDSELVARQVTGVYKVKHPAMQELHREALAALARF